MNEFEERKQAALDQLEVFVAALDKLCNHGGSRPGSGRKPKTLARCHCGKHTLARAVRLRLKCRKP